ncbi:uncharacterized protein C8Q71DRAFT_863371 [Rhodofomes roseus]|uniref:Uncharacterized protein n=1 Tax=Rhodofomes roseus TaxID=34475 RepID=A0ABQ8JYH8_9APHY|nr:uncharacterized protein C8Q71DRAFT_863371 [Rhodofomes roseus]KAH9829300.1 hypothetical protein C8Q71DRAFT_863371 [Rhodofomes roseus]
MKKLTVWADDQLATMEAYTAAFRLAEEPARRKVVDDVLGQLKTMPLQSLEQLTEKQQKAAVLKWLAQNCKEGGKKKKQKTGVSGTTRGLDVFRREKREEIYEAAYGGKEKKQFGAFRAKTYELWALVPPAEKKEYVAQGKEIRGLIHGNIGNVEPPVLPSKTLSRSLHTKCETFAKKLWIENGVRVCFLFAGNTTDKGPVAGLMDHNAKFGAPSNFSDVADDPDWNPTKLWSDWEDWATDLLGKKAESVLRSGNVSKAQKRTGFGPLLATDEATGLPRIPPPEELDTLQMKTAQEWQFMVRQFLNDHHTAASNGKKRNIPWKRAKALDTSLWIEDGSWPDFVKFDEPSKIRKSQCIELIRYWGQLQDTDEGRAFRMSGWLQDDGDTAIDDPEDVQPGRYDEWLARWIKDAPRREAERQREDERQAEERQAVDKQAASTRMAQQPGTQTQAGGANMASGSGQSGKQLAAPHLSAKALGKQKARKAIPSETPSPSLSPSWSSPEPSVNDTEEQAGDASEGSTAVKPTSTQTATAEPIPAELPFNGMAPSAARPSMRVNFLRSLSTDRRYMVLCNEYARAIIAAAKPGRQPRPAYTPPAIPGVPWASWSWGSQSLPQEVHKSSSGLDPLITYLRATVWVSEGKAALRKVEQVLLAVGLALRDIDSAQFVNDPDDPPSAGIPPFVVATQLGIASSNMLLDLIQPIANARIVDVFGKAPAPAAPPAITPNLPAVPKSLSPRPLSPMRSILPRAPLPGAALSAASSPSPAPKAHVQEAALVPGQVETLRPSDGQAMDLEEMAKVPTASRSISQGGSASKARRRPYEDGPQAYEAESTLRPSKKPRSGTVVVAPEAMSQQPHRERRAPQKLDL